MSRPPSEEITLRLLQADGSRRSWHGYVTQAMQLGADGGLARYRLVMDPMGKAKLMYLMHHEGEGAGPAFIRNTLGSLKGGTEGLKKKFATQLGKEGTDKANEQISQAAGDVEKAYRRWFGKFIDRNFSKAGGYFCSNPMKISELSDLMEDVGGQPL